MALRIILRNDIDNVSLQVGDVAYYVKDDKSDLSVTSFTDSIKIIGKIDFIGSNYIKIEAPSNVPPKDAFVMFSKNKIANNASLNGYFAEVKLNNNSTDKAELFSLGSEIIISSK